MQTVSRAVNDKGEIRPETRERILKAVRELGYRPNRLARAMSTQQTHLVGLIVPNIMNPYFPEVLRGVQDEAITHDYNVLVCNSDDQPENELNILEVLASQGVDGIITFSSKIQARLLSKFADTFRPLVFVNRFFEHPSTSLLRVDNMHGAQLAVDHFVKEGHTHIGMITNKDASFSTEPRVQGFVGKLKQHNRIVEDSKIVGASPTTNGGYQAATQLLNLRPEITALFAYNDLMAMGAIRACHDMGRAVPNDVSIIGFDDIQLASIYSPSLSSVRVDKYKLGRLALQRLLAMLDQPDAVYPPMHMSVELILRESTHLRT